MYVLTPIIEDFNRFWQLYQVDEATFPNRKAATLRQWQARSPAARKAMMDHLIHKGPPGKRNPFFWVQDFKEPRPTNMNGSMALDRLMKTTPLVCAKYNNSNGIFTLEDALLHHLDVNYGMNFEWEIYQQTGVIKWRERD